MSEIEKIEDYIREHLYVTSDGIESVHDSIENVRDCILGYIREKEENKTNSIKPQTKI